MHKDAGMQETFVIGCQPMELPTSGLNAAGPIGPTCRTRRPPTTGR